MEVSLLKVSDIDSRRMMIRVERCKGGGGRDIPLSPALLETLREYWRWKKPRTYLFPSSTGHHKETRRKSLAVAGAAMELEWRTDLCELVRKLADPVGIRRKADASVRMERFRGLHASKNS
ncbi:tyrosine-type recombinase/integrase [Occallatibacter savannae]|uniref:tyrosine-type recombinase/integrase n=1 Tax=Occallatibacter savannae TaxID=1002691 RepID=UPI001951A0DD|nr:tyrosine-type recombinase/integrase [Occallatibacter savannae]